MKPVLKIIITGSRELQNREFVWQCLDQTIGRAERVLIVHGKCPTGADAYASEWVKARRRTGDAVEEKPYPADWRKHGKAAGPIRNGTMVLEPDVDYVLAFFQDGAGNRGTSDCVEKALDRGLPVYADGDDGKGLRPVRRIWGAQ